MSLLRRLFPPRQQVRCASCALVFVERRRRPCPVCGSLNRIYSFGLADGVKVDVRMS